MCTVSPSSLNSSWVAASMLRNPSPPWCPDCIVAWLPEASLNRHFLYFRAVINQPLYAPKHPTLLSSVRLTSLSPCSRKDNSELPGLVKHTSTIMCIDSDTEPSPLDQCFDAPFFIICTLCIQHFCQMQIFIPSVIVLTLTALHVHAHK